MNHALTHIGAGVSEEPAAAVRAAKAGRMIEGPDLRSAYVDEAGSQAFRTTTYNYQAQMNPCACTR
jgi:hypothetical protein